MKQGRISSIKCPACWNIRPIVLWIALVLAFPATLAHAIAPVCDPEGDDTWQTAQEVMLNAENVGYCTFSCDGSGGLVCARRIFYLIRPLTMPLSL